MHQFDVSLFKLINLQLANPWLDHVMFAASVLGTGAAQAAVCFTVLLYGWILDKHNIRTAAYAAVAACTGSVIMTQIVKHLWSRPRPLATIFEARAVGKALFWNSFPSGHTANSIAVAVALGIFLPKLRIVLFPLALLTAISRIYVGAHYPTDVIGGAALGFIIGSCCAALFRPPEHSADNLRSHPDYSAAGLRTTQALARLPLQHAAYVVLALMCFVLFCWRLGAVPLIGLDEGLYSECAREMAAGGSWIVPTVNGRPFFDKPPLAYWLMAISIRAFGTNSFAVRLPSCLAACTLTALVYFLAAKLQGAKVGWMSAVVLATSLMTVGLARLAILDMLFALTLTAALGAYLLAKLNKLPQWSYLVAGASAGLSMLVKGPAGVILIALTIAIYMAITRTSKYSDNNTTANLRLFALSVLICLAVALPWYSIVQLKTQGAFLREFIIHQNLQRALGQDFHHNMPFYFYLPIYLIGFFPWSVFLPLAWSRYVTRRPQNAVDEAMLFAAVWIVIIIGVYSLLRSKLPAYIYPAFPPSALLVGRLFTESIEANKGDTMCSSMRRYSLAALLLACVIGCAIISGIRFLPRPIPRLETALVPMAVSLIAGMVVHYLAIRGYHVIQAIAALLLGVTGFLLAAVALGLPIAATSMGEPAVQIARQITKTARSDEPVFSYLLPSSFASLPFYSQRPIVPVKTLREITSSSRQPKSFLVVTHTLRSKELPQVRKQVARWGGYVIYRFEKTSYP